MNGEIYYTKGINNFDGKREYLRQCFGDIKERYLSYYMPLCAFHDNWVNLKQENFSENADNTDFLSTMGYVYTEGITAVTIPDPSTFEQEELSNDSLDILDGIVRICNEREIKIIFYTAPWEGAYSFGDAMKKYADKNKCVYFNLYEYINEIGFNGETDFCDIGHLNDSGAIKVADFLGKYIVDNYEVTDMRSIKGNIWERNIQN